MSETTVAVIATIASTIVIALVCWFLIWAEEQAYRRKFNRESKAIIAALSARFGLGDEEDQDLSKFSDQERWVAYRAMYGDE